MSKQESKSKKCKHPKVIKFREIYDVSGLSVKSFYFCVKCGDIFMDRWRMSRRVDEYVSNNKVNTSVSWTITGKRKVSSKIKEQCYNEYICKGDCFND